MPVCSKTPASSTTPASSKTPAWSVGQRVLAQWSAEVYYYAGIIKAAKGAQFHVHFDDGDEAWVTADQITELEIPVGRRVFARWQRGPGYFPGVVDQQKGESIHVRYDDGDEEWTTVSMVRVERST